MDAKDEKGKKQEKPRIAVLMGGRTSEREISLKTGANIAPALRGLDYPVEEIDADGDVLDRIKAFNADACFIALHGAPGEDGTIQGLLEYAGFPYTGSGVLASALAMNKVMSKRIFSCLAIPTAPYRFFPADKVADERGVETALKVLDEAGIAFPMIVKPVAGGSTLGITIIPSAREIANAFKTASEYCSEILVEKFIQGIEVTVGILGDAEPFALPVMEIVPEGGFYNYETKYVPGKSTHLVPARIPEDVMERCKDIALTAFHALGCFGMARVDMMISKQDNRIFVLEVNTIPGMTQTSLLPEAALNVGIDFGKLVEMQVEFAVKRFKRQQKYFRNKSEFN